MQKKASLPPVLGEFPLRGLITGLGDMPHFLALSSELLARLFAIDAAT